MIDKKVFFSFVLLITLFTTFLLVSLKKGMLNSPPQIGDGPDYDCIAYQLAQGNGFSVDWNDPGFRKPYEGKSDYDYLLKYTGKGKTTERPPLLPVIMAVSYKIFGREFQAIRVIICLMMALSATILFTVSVERLGYWGGTATTLLFVSYSDTWVYSNVILTEAPACLVSAALLLTLFKVQETRSAKWLVLTGFLAAIAFYARSILIIWFPAIVFVLYWIYRDTTQKTSLQKRLMPILIFCFSCLLFTTPWFIRNCVVTGKFTPLGTMGSRNMPAAYSDEAVSYRGRWFDFSNTKLLQTSGRNGKKSADSKHVGIEWIKKNPSKVPLLMAFKTIDTWRPESKKQACLYLLMLLGILFYPIKQHLVILLSVIVANTFAVALTWSVGGRFLFPTLPFMAMLAGGGLYGAIQHFRKLWKNEGIFSSKQI